jgi:hypothetical protein
MIALLAFVLFLLSSLNHTSSFLLSMAQFAKRIRNNLKVSVKRHKKKKSIKKQIILPNTPGPSVSSL